ncbi:hypothetical protein [Allobranchiibius huperziae]|uniref:Uncharacterized protein n=1 Tax=Allobranchiibius huperziae TaxID=1874116 RepID=A0A853DKP2_9MICO|nr:hypothetical protein [Allobranchiibius huperziae]NYJ76509.1 hypothetical protein [Allobranchiibius huperziae]
MTRDINVLRLRMSRAKRRQAATKIAADAASLIDRGERTVTLSVTNRRTLNAFGKRAGSFQPETLRRLEQRVMTELSTAHPGQYVVHARRCEDSSIEVQIDTLI